MKEDESAPLPKPACIYSYIKSMDIILQDMVDFLCRELGQGTILLWIKEAFEPNISSEDAVPASLVNLFHHDPYLIVQLLVAAIRTFEERTCQLQSFILEPPIQDFTIQEISKATKCIWEHVFKHYLHYYLRVKGVPVEQPRKVSEMPDGLLTITVNFIHGVYADKALFNLIKDSFKPPLSDERQDLRPRIIELLDANPMFIMHILVTCAKVYQYEVENPDETCTTIIQIVGDVVDDLAPLCYPPPQVLFHLIHSMHQI